MVQMGHLILRNFHSMGPTQFHQFNQRVATALGDKTRFSDAFWGSNAARLESYFATSDKHNAVYHESMLGSKVVIAEREVIQAQLVISLDEIASLLEIAALRTPDILVASGYDLGKERRGRSRAKLTAAARTAVRTDQGDGESGTPA